MNPSLARELGFSYSVRLRSLGSQAPIIHRRIERMEERQIRRRDFARVAQIKKAPASTRTAHTA
jgi:hypothetical protein